MNRKRSLLLRVLVLPFLLLCAQSRPLVRNIRTHAEYKKLIDHHKVNTGLPVIIDFFSQSCGPCRMIAPHFKKLASKYKDKAVFAKVDVNSNRESSSHAQIRSMPTFMFYLDGKMRHKFSGGDTNQLNQWTETLSREAERNNVKLTKANLNAFYSKYAPEKATDENLDKIIQKAGGESGGKGHRKLAEALKKKYGKPPKLMQRTQASSSTKTEPKASTSTSSKPKSTTSSPASISKIPTEDFISEFKTRYSKNPDAFSQIQSIFSSDNDSDQDDEEDDHAAADDDDLLEEYGWKDEGFVERVVIIGAGPAGLTAALYASRAGLNPVVVAPLGGGQLQGKGVLVENFPGVSQSTGPELVKEMMLQSAFFGTTFIFEKVESVDFSDPKAKLVFFEGGSVKAQSVILASGSDAKWIGSPGEDDLKGKGVSACAVCDGFLYVGREVVVIGGGDSAMEEALHLSQTCSKVTIIHRSDKFRASKILQHRVKQNQKIHLILNSTVASFVATQQVNEDGETESVLKAVELEVVTNGEKSLRMVETSGAFVAIGHLPNSFFVENQVDLKSNGYIKVFDGTTKTSVAGVFASGDVADHYYRQAITSSGTGAMAALDAERWLQEEGFEDERALAEAEFMKELLEEIEELEAEREGLLGFQNESEECTD